MPLQDEHEAALARLVASGQLTAAQAQAVRQEFEGVLSKPAKAGWLVEAAAYAGGALMLAGAALFLGTQWETLSDSFKVVLLLGISAVFIAAAFFLTADQGIRKAVGARGRAAGALLALAAIPAAFAAEVPSPAGNDGQWAMTAGLVVSLAALALRSSALGIVIGAFFTGGAAFTLLNDFGERHVLPTALVLLAAGALWTAAGFLGWLRPKPLALVAGGVLAITGAQYPLADGRLDVLAYVLTLAVSAICFALFRWSRSMVMLVGGVAGLTLAVPEWVYDLTNGGLSPAVILLIAGIVLLTGSAFGMQLRKR
ncbi:DUF2157 domain-containing protein [Catelliglobosispora koreensis]|uniref:DUF2157 domain-containing protein n=1 Tax=Catelliglobosispora koreensis TaxID=129052 RepID=UPI00036AFB24|nr:DUF2157 domain-containing protein [Catelliglobosispora koreensis]